MATEYIYYLKNTTGQSQRVYLSYFDKTKGRIYEKAIVKNNGETDSNKVPSVAKETKEEQLPYISLHIEDDGKNIILFASFPKTVFGFEKNKL